MKKNNFFSHKKFYNIFSKLIFLRRYKEKQSHKGHLLMNKVSLQTSLKSIPSNLSYISFSGVNFENLIVEFQVPYILNMHIKFHSNRILFTM